MKVGTRMKSLEKTLNNVLNDFNTIYGNLNEEDMKKAALESSLLVSELKDSKIKVRKTHKFLSGTTIIISLIISTFMIIWFNNYNTLGLSDELIFNVQFIASIVINYVLILIVCLGISFYFSDYLNKRLESYTPNLSSTDSFEEKMKMLNESEKHTNRNTTLGMIGYAATMLCIVIYSPYLYIIFSRGNISELVIIFILSVFIFIALISRIILEFKLRKVQKVHNKKWKAHEIFYRNLNRMKDN